VDYRALSIAISILMISSAIDTLTSVTLYAAYNNRLVFIVAVCHRGGTLRLARRKAIVDTQRIRDKSWTLWQLAAGCSKDRISSEQRSVI
jgi:hypothetical protein